MIAKNCANVNSLYFQNRHFAKDTTSPVKRLFDSINNEEELSRLLEQQIELDEMMKHKVMDLR